MSGLYGAYRVSTHSRLKAAGTLYWVCVEMLEVSTHSRLKAAGSSECGFNTTDEVSTHSRLKAAGARLEANQLKAGVSTHSRLKAAGSLLTGFSILLAGFNTQPPKGGWLKGGYYAFELLKFQHTAA